MTTTIENIDKKQENAESAANSAPQALPKLMQNHDKTQKREKLPAEKLFNWGVYGGLNYLIQVSTAVVVTEWIKHGGGKKYFASASEWVGKNVVSKLSSKTGAAAAAEAHTPLVAASLIMVGNAFLIPVKWFENHKPHFVRKIDDHLIKNLEKKGLELTAEERKRHEEAHAALAAEPKQSWWTLIGARIGALFTVQAAIIAVGENKNEWMQSKAADIVQSGLKNSGVKTLEKIGHSPRIRNFAEIAFVDFAYSIIVASSVFVYSRLLSPKTPCPPVEPVAQTPPPETTADKPSFTNQSTSPPHEKMTVRKRFTDYAKPAATEPQVAL